MAAKWQNAYNRCGHLLGRGLGLAALLNATNECIAHGWLCVPRLPVSTLGPVLCAAKPMSAMLSPYKPLIGASRAALVARLALAELKGHQSIIVFAAS